MKDRRTVRRYGMSLSVIVRAPGENAASRTGKTRDLSPQGVYFTVDGDLKAGAQLNLTIILPAQITRGPEVFIEALGTVVRVEQHHTEDHLPIGAAAIIERYEMVRNETTTL